MTQLAQPAQLVQLRAANAASADRAPIRSTIGSMGPQKPNEQYIGDAGRMASADVNTPAMAPGHQQQTPAQAKITSTNGPGGCDAPHDNDDGENRDVGGDGFQVSRQQRLREQKQAKRSSRKAVYGWGSNAALRAGKQTREVFVFNLDGATTAEELTEFLNDIGI